MGSSAPPARVHRGERHGARLARAAAPPQQVLPLIASPTSQPPVDNREPLAASCGQSKTLGKSGSFQDSLHTPHCPLALSTQPTFQCPGVGACGVCWATASNLGSYDAQRLADTEGFDATARWGCNSHRPGAVSGCCDLLKTQRSGRGRPPAIVFHLGLSGRLPGPGSGHVDIWRLEWQTTRPLARPLSNTRPRHGRETQPPIVQRSIRCPSQNVSVAGETRPTAGHGGRSLWSEAQVSWTCAVAPSPPPPRPSPRPSPHNLPVATSSG